MSKFTKILIGLIVILLLEIILIYRGYVNVKKTNTAPIDDNASKPTLVIVDPFLDKTQAVL